MQITSALTYATQRAPLDAQISGILANSNATPVDFRVMAAVVPHSDDLRGAALAADVYRSFPDGNIDTVISVAPNRGEEFKRITVCSLDSYLSPLGDVVVNDGVRNELCDEDDDIFLDDRGHFHRAGLDVNLPYLQKILGDFSVVPLVMGAETPEFCRELGSAVGEIMANQTTLVVACMDIIEATERGVDQFQQHLTNLDIPAMMALLNQETDIRIEGKGPLLVAMMASVHRRANQVSWCGIDAPSTDGPGFAGALMGRH